MSTYYTPTTALSGLNLDNISKKWALLMNVYLINVSFFLLWVSIGLVKSSFMVFHKILKNPNELFGQPDIYRALDTCRHCNRYWWLSINWVVIPSLEEFLYSWRNGEEDKEMQYGKDSQGVWWEQMQGRLWDKPRVGEGWIFKALWPRRLLDC